ncbi:hypothetical protein EV356DRAFT_504211 [Viridothelium virens]|uniref:Cupin 2 conserved barrel domain-containing protein n=1 Tax=Viridothelium virens TaxID=1048519 RepID=A0A6A6HLM1_VIRVR|nr:hypothetical protein EV356DRAFT_504211 [Viridothelium virens]
MAEGRKLFAAFNGAILTHVIPHPVRAFAFTVRFTETAWPSQVRRQKPPMHFHPHQEEYIEVTEGRLCVEVEGKEFVYSKHDGEITIKPGMNHRLYPPGEFFDGGFDITFTLSAQATPLPFQLDTIFFENWYGYQDEVILTGKRMDILQVMSMFDAGGSYLTFPSWIPFRNHLSYGLSIALGRWIGGFLGYQPYYRKWTGDWELACQKMKSSYFQKRFAIHGKTT